MNENEYMSNVVSYLITMAVIRRLLSQGVITRGEYARVDKVIAKKHGLAVNSIFSDSCCGNL